MLVKYNKIKNAPNQTTKLNNTINYWNIKQDLEHKYCSDNH